MERSNTQENKKAKINRIISYVIIVVSIIALLFCLIKIVAYVKLVNENKKLSKNLEELKQDSNYLKGYFPVLNNEDYYSVYIDGDYQYVDGNSDSVKVIK